MSHMPDPALGSFEERLLTALKTQIDTATVPTDRSPVRRSARLMPGRSGWRRPLVAAAAALAAAAVPILSAIPSSNVALAQVFPILNQHPRTLPTFLRRILAAHGWGARVDVRHAYAFQTPTGTGYVVVEPGSRRLCIVVPGFDPGGGGAHCVTVTAQGSTSLPLRLSLTDVRHAREEVVALLPAGSEATLRADRRRARTITLHKGVLAVVVHGSARITTTVGGHRSTVTYGPTGPTSNRASR